MKECFVCKIEKDKSCFSLNKRKRDGLDYRCKKCHREYYNRNKEQIKYKSNKYRIENIEKVRAYDRRRSKSSERRESIRNAGIKYSKTDAGKVSSNKASKKSKLKYRNATLSRCKLSNSIRIGEVEKEYVCNRCGSDNNVNAHHHDYNLPYDVEWMCKACHVYWHKNNTPKNREYGIFNKKQKE